MYHFSKVLIESSDYESILAKQFKAANIGVIKKSGIKKVLDQIRTGKLNFEGFPLWVLQSWIEPSKFGALPLQFNRWLDVQYVVNGSTEIDSDEIIYSGFVVDANRKIESGSKSISLTRSHEVDPLKYAKLLKYKLTANEARKFLDELGDDSGEQSLRIDDPNALGAGKPNTTTPPPSGTTPIGGSELSSL